jgi:alpha-ketoglutarate-dependent taurine dioxygenase
MKYNLISYWVVEVLDFDVNTEFSSNRKEIYELLTTYGAVLFRKQSLTVPAQEKIIRENFYLNPDYLADSNNNQVSDWYIKDSNILIRVTSELNENGHPGAFCNKEGLPWHSDNPTNLDDKNVTWLYGARGVEGSVTSYCNTNIGFNNLPNDLKTFAKSLIAESSSKFISSTGQNFIFPLYSDCGLGKLSWTFPYNQIKKFQGYTIDQSKAIVELLREPILDEKYCYHHQWQLGDLMISNEKISIHKRPPFDNMDYRLLHKGIMGFLTEYNNVL